ncbi:hypothetical protein ElyMa_000448500 [Elysia marginata]|uniref:Uncharacterized protein n=1 Tax=Elysia marginata TaxID=1093978 RepID=A0AAV4FSG9_9GAST|nr:hypothetical protein ElyMa_000448500 [Elysia marginata]
MAEKEDLSKIPVQLLTFQIQFDELYERIGKLEQESGPVQEDITEAADEPSDHTRSNCKPTTVGPSASTAADIQITKRLRTSTLKELLQRTPVFDNYKSSTIAQWCY